MELTVLDLKRIRLMVNDPMPINGVGELPLFTDLELKTMAIDYTSIYFLITEIWMIKAGLIQGDIQSYSAGNEKYDLTSMKDRYTHALAMAKLYADKADAEAEPEAIGGSVMLKFRTPDVM